MSILRERDQLERQEKLDTQQGLAGVLMGLLILGCFYYLKVSAFRNSNKNWGRIKRRNGRQLISIFPLCSGQAVTQSCRWSFRLQCGPVQSRKPSSWSWSMTWAPSRPCPPFHVPMQRGQRSLTWGASRSQSKRQLQCSLVRPWNKKYGECFTLSYVF